MLVKKMLKNKGLAIFAWPINCSNQVCLWLLLMSESFHDQFRYSLYISFGGRPNFIVFLTINSSIDRSDIPKTQCYCFVVFS